MHQVIAGRTGITSNPDHKDRDGLNNQRDNLRVATHAQNDQNRGLRRDNTSGYKGVSWRKDKKKWQAHIKVNQHARHLGYFKSKLTAAKVYDTAAIRYFGKFAALNFPLDIQEI
jgi:hypothetical protein